MFESAKVDNHCMWVIAYNEAAFAAVPAGGVGGAIGAVGGVGGGVVGAAVAAVVVGGCLRQQ